LSLAIRILGGPGSNQGNIGAGVGGEEALGRKARNPSIGSVIRTRSSESQAVAACPAKVLNPEQRQHRAVAALAGTQPIRQLAAAHKESPVAAALEALAEQDRAW
jgi:hypothetical protein